MIKLALLCKHTFFFPGLIFIKKVYYLNQWRHYCSEGKFHSGTQVSFLIKGVLCVDVVLAAGWRKRVGKFSVYFVLTVGVNLSISETFKLFSQSHKKLFLISSILNIKLLLVCLSSSTAKELKDHRSDELLRVHLVLLRILVRCSDGTQDSTFWSSAKMWFLHLLSIFE